MFSSTRITILLTSILLIAFSAAAPAPQAQTPSVVFRRAEQKPVTCGRNLFHEQKKYSKKAVQTAFDELVRLMNFAEDDKPMNPKSGKRYPAAFFAGTSSMRSVPVVQKLMLDKDCEPNQKGTSYLEFPLMDEKYTGGDPDKDRVLAIVYGTKKRQYSDALYCLSMTHRDAPWNDHDAADTDDEAAECS